MKYTQCILDTPLTIQSKPAVGMTSVFIFYVSMSLCVYACQVFTYFWEIGPLKLAPGHSFFCVSVMCVSNGGSSGIVWGCLCGDFGFSKGI